MQPNNPWQQPGQPQQPNVAPSGAYPSQPSAGSPAQPGVPPQQPGSPMQSPQQAQPALPYFLQDNGPAVPPPAQPSRLKVVLFGLLIVVAVVGFLFMLLSPSSPVSPSASGPSADQLFSSALDTSLTANSVTVTEVSGKNKLQLAENLSNLRSPAIAATGTLTSGAVSVQYDGYVTPSDSFIRYQNVVNSAVSGQLASSLNKWVAVRADDSLPNGYGTGLDATFDPNAALFSGFPVLKLSTTDQTDLKNYILSHKVYSYDAGKVTKATIGSDPVMVYTVTSSQAKLSEVAQKVADYAGISTSTLRVPALPTQFKLYVTTGTRQVRRIAGTIKGQDFTIDYTNYGSTKVSAQSDGMAWGDFVKSVALTGFSNYQGLVVVNALPAPVPGTAISQ